MKVHLETDGLYHWISIALERALPLLLASL